MGAQLVRTLRQVLTARDWWHLPRFAFGSSRGGAMTLILALRFPFQVRGEGTRHLCACPSQPCHLFSDSSSANVANRLLAQCLADGAEDIMHASM